MNKKEILEQNKVYTNELDKKEEQSKQTEEDTAFIAVISTLLSVTMFFSTTASGKLPLICASVSTILSGLLLAFLILRSISKKRAYYIVFSVFAGALFVVALSIFIVEIMNLQYI